MSGRVAHRASKRERGAVLAMVVASAVIASLTAYYVLLIATSQAYRAAFFRQRARARYVAEAGLVLARQRLIADPNYPGCGSSPATATEYIDTNGDGVAAPPDDPAVEIAVTNCGAGNAHAISARVVF